jgi:hypothetical protein
MVEAEQLLETVGRAGGTGAAHAAGVVDGPDVIALGYWQR